MSATTPTRSDLAIAPTAAGDEIARFDRIAGEWWDPEGDFKPLHLLNPVRVAYIRGVLARHFGRDPEAERPLEGLSFVDIGCGGGLVSEALTALGAAMTGIDASPESVGVARAHARAEGLEIAYRQAAPEDLVEEGALFDGVLALEVVEHVVDLGEFVSLAAQLSRPGGIFVFSTINRTLRSLALAKIGAEYVLRWVPRGTHDWRKFVKPSELAGSLRRAGLAMADVQGLVWSPLRAGWVLARDLEVNYIGYAR